MTLSLDLPSGKTLSADIADATPAGAEAWFNGLASPAAALGAGESAVVECGWATLKLVGDDEVVRVQEPDFHGTNPAEFINSVTVTHRVFNLQAQLLQTLRVPGLPLLSRQFVRVSVSAMSSVSVFGYRFAEDERLFTGWQISTTTPAVDQNFGVCNVRKIAAEHLVWLCAMCLPHGWAFRCVGHTVMDCVSPTGETTSVLLSIDL